MLFVFGDFDGFVEVEEVVKIEEVLGIEWNRVARRRGILARVSLLTFFHFSLSLLFTSSTLGSQGYTLGATPNAVRIFFIILCYN